MAGDGFDEDLPQPARREWPRLRRTRLPLLALGALGVAAGVVVAVAAHDAPPGRPSAVPGHAKPGGVARSAVALPSTLHVRVPGPDVVPNDGTTIEVLSIGPDGRVSETPALPVHYRNCPKGTVCEVRLDLPAPVLAALHDYLPVEGVAQSRSAVIVSGARPRLWERRVVVVARGYTVVLAVTRPVRGETTGGGLVETAGGLTGQVRVHTRGFSVTVRINAPSGADVPLRPLARLALDPRVLALPATSRGTSDDPGQR